MAPGIFIILAHTLYGVLYQYHLGGFEDIDIRLYNHLGFGAVSYSLFLRIVKYSIKSLLFINTQPVSQGMGLTAFTTFCK
jgi:hypothetical protein